MAERAGEAGDGGGWDKAVEAASQSVPMFGALSPLAQQAVRDQMRVALTAAGVPALLDVAEAAAELADTFGAHNNGRLVLELRAALATLHPQGDT